MDHLSTIEIRAFVPASDCALSRRFYADVGFEEKSEGDGVALFAAGDCSFLRQDFHHPEHAGNFAMHLLVADVDAGTGTCASGASSNATASAWMHLRTGHGGCATSA